MEGNRTADAAPPEPAVGDEERAMLTLAMLPGIGPRTVIALLDRFGTPDAVLRADEAQLHSVAGVGPQLLHKIRTAGHYVDVDSIASWCGRHRVRVVCRDSEFYPTRLYELDDAPAVLFVRGDWAMQDDLAVAVVGTRHPTRYGLKQAERFGYALAKAGITVISGLARGIDAAAHDAALSAGGRTVAVLGGGLGEIYPREHVGLADRIAAHGALLSEFAPRARPRAGMFPQRNRLIAGLCLATLVIEAPDRSGALITARLAGEQNREVMAVPGPVTSRPSRGCNQLIRDGATLVQNIDDVLEHLGPISEPITTGEGREIRNPAELRLNDLERQVLDVIEETGSPIDHVIRDSGLEPHRVIATISVLEMRRLVRRLGGQRVARI
jgi:DNA processing protein